MKNAKSSPTILLLIAIFAICAAGLPPPQALGQSLNEDSIKASYVLRFVDFVRWERPANKTVRIALAGEQSLLDELQSIAAKRSGPERAFKIVPFANGQTDLEGFDLLYIGRGHKNEWEQLIARSREYSVITVGSEEGFLEAGGLIEFVSKQNRLRFSLNLPAVDAYNVTLNSKLVQLSVR